MESWFQSSLTLRMSSKVLILIIIYVPIVHLVNRKGVVVQKTQRNNPMETQRDALVCIATAPHRWEIMENYCFNKHFRMNREHFDLCIVFNGYDADSIRRVLDLSPEHLIVRENVGMDQAAFDHCIKNIRDYNTYVLLHDDHWFIDSCWFQLLYEALHSNDVDVIGNLVAPGHINKPLNYDIIADVLGYSSFKPHLFPCFLQGQAGFYKKRAIDCLRANGGVPWGKTNTREVASICERLHSFILLSNGMKFAQIPPGYEKYLRHREHVVDPNRYE